MGTNEVEKEDESGDSRVGRVKGVEAAFGFVPSLELAVKGFNEIVGNIVFEALDANMGSIREEGLNRDFVSRVTVADNAFGSSELPCVVENGMSLRRITMRGEMKAENEARFAVDDEPNVVFDPVDFNNSFVGVPLVGVKVHRRNEFDGDVIE